MGFRISDEYGKLEKENIWAEVVTDPFDHIYS